jgi:hypothetical protein
MIVVLIILLVTGVVASKFKTESLNDKAYRKNKNENYRNFF